MHKKLRRISQKKDFLKIIKDEAILLLYYKTSNMKKKGFIALTLLAITGCNQAIDTKTEGEKLMQVSREWSKSAVERNVEKTVSYWSEDAIVLSAGQPDLKGKKAIRQMVEGSFNIPGFQISWEPKSAEISKSGDIGYLIEDTHITANDSTGKPVTKYYKSVTVWKKQTDGSWKNVVDVMSPEFPQNN
jgi:ketosteroid isomerase-like protein